MLEHYMTDATTGVSTVSKQHEAALKLASQGIPVFPLVQNGKTPITKTGYKEATTDMDAINGWWSKNPEANIGVPTEGLLVLDVDCKNDKDGYAALKQLEAVHGPLPLTKTQKTASGGMHHIYNATGIPNRVNCPAPGLDIRGTGGYIVYAPSMIDGVEYVVSDDEIVEAPQWLLDLVLNPARIPTTEPTTVPEGGRNDFIFRKGLECARQGLSLDEGLAMAKQANAACDPPLDDKELEKTVKSAYRCEEDRVTTTVINELNEKHAVINVGGKFRVMKEVVDPDTGLPDLVFSAPADFKMFYCNRTIKVGSIDMPVGQFWLTSQKRREYAGITFNPHTTPEGYYNLWTGFAVKPKKGDCSLFLGHIMENIANGNKVIFDYIVAWMAQAVQKPHVLLGVALVLRGAMGVGKGVFAGGFGSLFGRHYLPLSQGSQLTGKFNAHMKDKCLLFADEAFWAGDKAAEGVLKSLITEPFLVIEGKGENAFKIKNNLHFIFATNNDWCVPAGPQERRFFVVDVGEKHMQDHPYFAAIENELDNGGREALLDYLLNYDIGSRNLRIFPQTPALMEQKVFSMTPIQKFWFEKLQSGLLSNPVGWDTEIPTRDLYEQFIDFCNRIGVRFKPSDSEFGTQLRKLVPGLSTAKGRSRQYGNHRPNVYRVPPLADCRQAFEKFINYEVEWPVFEEPTTTAEATPSI